MKTLVKVAAFAAMSVLAVSCCKCDKENEKCFADGPRPEMMHCPAGGPEKGKCPMMDKMRAMDEKWAKFDELSEAEQKALIAEKKALIDSIQAKRDAFKEKMKKDWENFDNLSVDEQKRLLDMKSHHGRRHCKRHNKA